MFQQFHNIEYGLDKVIGTCITSRNVRTNLRICVCVCVCFYVCMEKALMWRNRQTLYRTDAKICVCRWLVEWQFQCNHSRLHVSRSLWLCTRSCGFKFHNRISQCVHIDIIVTLLARNTPYSIQKYGLRSAVKKKFLLRISKCRAQHTCIVMSMIFTHHKAVGRYIHVRHDVQRISPIGN